MRKHISHMTQEEIDSLRRLPGGADTIDVIAAQKQELEEPLEK